MIKANELRVGNYFNEISRHTEIHLPTISIFKIVEIHLFEVETIHYDVDILKTDGYHTIKMRDLSPIPLTPEILEKCGFVNKPTGNYKLSYERIEDEFSNFRTWWYRGDIYIEPIGDDKGYISIKYLHRLQNLYFALTGKELEFKHDINTIDFGNGFVVGL